jgi:hypothetical protein
VRRVTLGLVYARSLEGRKASGVTVEEAHRHVASRLESQAVREAEVKKVLHALAAEFDAEVAPDADGRLVFRFPEIRRQVAAGEGLRRSLSLEGRTVGDIVFDTGDTPAEADARDQAAFDRALTDVDLSGYVPSPERVGYEADYEVVRSDEEVRGGRLARA